MQVPPFQDLRYIYVPYTSPLPHVRSKRCPSPSHSLLRSTPMKAEWTPGPPRPTLAGLGLVSYDGVLQSPDFRFRHQRIIPRFLLLDMGPRDLDDKTQYPSFGAVHATIALVENHGFIPTIPPNELVVVRCRNLEHPAAGPLLVLMHANRVALPAAKHADPDYVGTPSTTILYNPTYAPYPTPLPVKDYVGGAVGEQEFNDGSFLGTGWDFGRFTMALEIGQDQEASHKYVPALTPGSVRLTISTTNHTCRPHQARAPRDTREDGVHLCDDKIIPTSYPHM